jgi:hypothetical protein
MSAITTVNRLDYVNIGLLIFSCILAFIMPFELFLFAYGVLGPLHYLTEISWLHDKNYYANLKAVSKDYTELRKLQKLGESENKLAQDFIGTDKLLSRLNA